MARIFVFDHVDGLDKRLVFTAADAAIAFGPHFIKGNIFVATRAGQVAIAVEIPDSWVNGVDIADRVRRGELGARAEIEERNGLHVISNVWLVTGDGNRAWIDGAPRDMLSDSARWWQVHVEVAALAERPLPMPAGAREPGDDTVNLEISGDITVAMADQMVDEIERAAGQTIALTIDSHGGVLPAALSIYQALTAHDALVLVHIDRAESAAAVVALAGDHRTIAADGTMMVHRPTVATNPMEAGELRAAAKRLDDLADEIAAIVATATNHDISTAKAWVDGEQCFNAGQTIMVGLCHGVSHDAAPAIPRASRARFANIAGPFNGVTPQALQRAPLLELGRVYDKGDRARFNGQTYRAKAKTFGAAGSLAPDRDHVAWERAR